MIFLEQVLRLKIETVSNNGRKRYQIGRPREKEMENISWLIGYAGYVSYAGRVLAFPLFHKAKCRTPNVETTNPVDVRFFSFFLFFFFFLGGGVDKGTVLCSYTSPCLIGRLFQSQTYRSVLARGRFAERCEAGMQAKLMDKHDFIGGSNKPAGVTQATKGA